MSPVSIRRKDKAAIILNYANVRALPMEDLFLLSLTPQVQRLLYQHPHATVKRGGNARVKRTSVQ